jgi:glycerol-3-phosphate O-acyltransferase/dihydroxyacetone phosphate acyltransferase
MPGQQRSLDKLKAMRLHLSNEVSNLINDFGPLQYEDFNEWRILVPSASVPPSSGTPGLWRRKSGTGAVDAQGLGLTHPMTWLDERIFGFRQAGTAENSDEEDSGDYDNVLAYLPVPSDGSLQPVVANNPRSRQSSYADLQRLRMAAQEEGHR